VRPTRNSPRLRATVVDLPAGEVEPRSRASPEVRVEIVDAPDRETANSTFRELETSRRKDYCCSLSAPALKLIHGPTFARVYASESVMVYEKEGGTQAQGFFRR
jgi:hypothetical protein